MMLVPVASADVASDRPGLRECTSPALRLVVTRSGADLIVAVVNRSRGACTVGGLPEITFSTRHGVRLPIAWRNPFFGGGHGPVVVPAAIAAGGQATSTLSFGVTAGAAQRCVRRAEIVVTWGFRLKAILPFPLCYAADGSTEFGQPWFRSAS